MARYMDADGAEKEALVLGAEGSRVHFAEVAAVPPVANAEVALASLDAFWETAWIDMGKPRVDKRLLDMTLVFRKEVEGDLLLEMFVDLDDSAAQTSQTVTLSDSKLTVVWGQTWGRHFKLRISIPHMASVVQFALASIVWRVSDETQEGAG